MKVYGERILDRNLRFTFYIAGDELSAADKKHIDYLNEVVADNIGGDASLQDVVDALIPLVDSEGEVKVVIEPIYDDE